MDMTEGESILIQRDPHTFIDFIGAEGPGREPIAEAVDNDQ